MTDILAQYRFLPWSRRGLVAEIQQPASGETLPARAKVKVGITISNIEGSNGVDFSLYGPGDVIGFDQRLIVRVSPQRAMEVIADGVDGLDSPSSLCFGKLPAQPTWLYLVNYATISASIPGGNPRPGLLRLDAGFPGTP